MHSGLDFLFGKLGNNGTPAIHVDNKLVIHALVARIIHRQIDPGILEDAAIFAGDCAAFFRPCV